MRLTLSRSVQFLSSMNLAITLLLVIAVASVIGTILRQNEPYQNYIIKFGPFWHDIYRRLGLYDIYSTPWFVLIMAFLVCSVSICLYRNTPKILASARNFQLHQRANHIQHLTHHARLDTQTGMDKLLFELQHWLKQQGYRVQSQATGEGMLVAAIRGEANRYGYLLTHVAVIIICIGGLLDSNFPLKLKTRTGQVQIETRDDIPLSAMDKRTILSKENPSFRASVSIPEGRRVNTAFINMGAGYVVQPLPFSIQVQDFRIEHYNNGQPKSFASDLRIVDKANATSLEQTILVNHPLNYRGYTIYQASFGDGGSVLKFSLFDLQSPTLQKTAAQLAVSETMRLPGDADALQLELTEFKKFNIFPDNDAATDKKFRDFGPSLTFKLRQADGTAREYLNYMYPVTIAGRDYLLSGVRESPQADYRYLHIPADDNGSAELFLRFLALLNDEVRLRPLLQRNSTMLIENTALPISPAEITNVLIRLVDLFRRQGFDGLKAHFSTASDAGISDAQDLQNASLKMLQFALQQSYLKVLEDSDLFTGELSAHEIQFLNDSIIALSSLHEYGTTYFIQLDDFEEIQATGLQISRSPGAKWVYLGFLLLTLGVFMLFYIPHQRLWFLLSGTDTGTHLLYGGSRTRHQADFGRYFANISHTIKQTFAAH